MAKHKNQSSGVDAGRRRHTHDSKPMPNRSKVMPGTVASVITQAYSRGMGGFQ